MECPQCGLTNPPGITACTACSTPLPASERTLTITPSVTAAASDRTMDDVSGWSAPVAAGSAGTSRTLEPGRMLGNRYEILQLLGEGGMGAVYKARDRELDRLVALKIIRPELAQNADALHRFKQELILARQVTHRNVIRIFDLGEADGVKFITMEYIDGRDLKSLLREKGKFPPAEATGVIEQICRALEAAHMEGVIHRDLKPQNVMVDAQGKASVMDFGIARSMEIGSGGMTQTGALVGTPEYMSPEQAKGEKVDARSDLFSLGIIFYELLTGNSPYKADTAMQSLYKRTVEPARPPIELISDIPQELSDIVLHCLEIDKTKRFGTATEILEDLALWRGVRPGTAAGRARGPTATVAAPPVPAAPLSVLDRFKSSQKWLVPALAVLIAVGAFVVIKKPGFHSAAKPDQPAQPAIALAILPFRNASGDPSLDWLGSSLADMLSTDVGQSAHLHPVSSDRLRQVLHDLQITPDATSDAATLHRITSVMNADSVVSGQYAKFGDQIRVDATLRDVKQDRAVSFKTQAPSEKDLLTAVDQLAQMIRDNLALSPQIVNELKAQSFKPSSKSMNAIRLYSEGVDLAGKGNNLEALKRFQASTQADPEFALAYARVGQTYANLGHDNEAEQASRKAVGLAENLPAREKYLITANYARVERDYPKAIESYENLAAASPEDPEIQSALARLYEDTGVFDKARDHYSKVLSIDPKYLNVLIAMGRLEAKSGNPQPALDFFNRGLTLAIQFENEEARATVLQGIGFCYRQLGKNDEALRYYQQSLEGKRRLGDKRGMALTLNSMAQIQDQLGKSDLALKGYQEALQIRREIGDKGGVGDTLLDLGGFYDNRGHYDQALGFFKEALQVQRELGSESSQGLCLNNIGITYLDKGDYENALTYFQQALELRERSQLPQDIALTLHNLALTSEKLGQYEKALSYYVRALELYRNAGDKRSAAMDSYGMGMLFGYQGRFGAAIKAKQDALKSFMELQDRTYWMTEVLSGYGMALADAGRLDEAQKPLDDALALSRELKIDGSIAQALDYQGECSFYRGDFKSAHSLYEQGLQFASRSKEQEKILLSKFHLAKAMLKQGKAPEAAVALRKLATDTDSLGLKYLSLEASAYLGQALVESKDYEHARQELERVAAKTEKLELRAVLAQAHYSLATALRLSGHGAEATAHYRQALQYLDEIRKDAGSDAVLQRSDLNIIYTESTRWSQNKAA
jgi:tetratricopeptide (TPR) repeat protein/predicted Ser/Thr protein kinase